MSQESMHVVESFYNAMKARDLGSALALIDPNVQWSEAENFVYADQSPYVGRDNLINGLFMRLATEWEGFAAIPEQYVGTGDTVAVMGRYRGTFRATAKPVSAQMVHVFKIAGGKIVRFQQYTDTAQFRDVVSA